MQVRVSARHMEISSGTRQHVDSDLRAVLSKFAERPTEASVTFGREAQLQHCEITVHLSTGLTVQARSSAPGVRAAFDLAIDKLGKQLRRYKRRLKNHHHERTTPVSYSGALSSVLASAPEEPEDGGPDSLQPVIIAEMETRIPMLSVGEAVMQMELAEKSMLLFRNQSHGRINVVHRRDDGNIGWIDPKLDD